MGKKVHEVVSEIKKNPARLAAFQEWWDEDWSWDGLAKHDQNRPLKLEIYWSDQKDDLIAFAGRNWTVAHLPPCNRDGSIVCDHWFESKGIRFWELVDRKLDIETDQARNSAGEFFSDGSRIPRACLHGVVFPNWRDRKSDLTLSGNFENSLFLGWCDFQHRSFSRTSFENAKFIGDAVYFSNATFSGWANFSRVKVITGLSTFSDAVFNTSASFRDSQLEWTDFNEVKFLDGCDFSDAIWAGIHFKGAEFGGQYAHFDRILADGAGDFSFASFNCAVSFVDARFNYDVSFRCDKGGNFAAAADFNGTIFCRKADFSGREFKQAVDFRGASFLGLPLFYDCDLPKESLFERSAFVARPWQAPLTEVTRQAFAESENHERVLKRKLRFNDMHNHFRGLKRDEFDSKVPTSVLWSKRARLFENAFQALRQHCASNGNVEDELNFHALELDARSARNDIPIFDRIIILFYKWFSDFGRSMWRPIWILLCLVPIATLAVGEYIAHYIDGEKIIIAGVPNPSQSEFYIFAIRNFIPPPPVWSENMGRTWLVGLSDTAKMVMFALGTLQTLTFGILVALFLIALRRRFQIRV